MPPEVFDSRVITDALGACNVATRLKALRSAGPARIGGGFEDEPLEVAVFCPICEALEFGDT